MPLPESFVRSCIIMKTLNCITIDKFSYALNSSFLMTFTLLLPYGIFRLKETGLFAVAVTHCEECLIFS